MNQLIILSLLGLLRAQEKTAIIIDNRRLMHASDQYGQWLNSESQNPNTQHVVGELNKLHAKTKMRILRDQKKALKPLLKNVKTLVEWIRPDEKCDLDLFAQCVQEYQPESIMHGFCNNESDCAMKIEDVTHEQGERIESEFEANIEEFQFAINDLTNDV